LKHYHSQFLDADAHLIFNIRVCPEIQNLAQPLTIKKSFFYFLVSANLFITADSKKMIIKKIYLSFFGICYHLIIVAQLSPDKYKISISKEIKADKHHPGVEVITYDNSGIYYSETWLSQKPAYALNKDFVYSVRLTKVDKNFATIYTKDYEKELQGRTFVKFQPLGNFLYLFASYYEKKGRSYKQSVAKVDKKTGEPVSDFVEFGNIDVQNLEDDFSVKIDSLKNGGGFFYLYKMEKADNLTIGLYLIDKNLEQKESGVIDLSIDPGYCLLMDLQFTNDKKVIILGAEFQDDPNERKKKVIFKGMALSIYNIKTKKIKKVNVNLDKQVPYNCKLAPGPSGEMFIVGYYSTTESISFINRFCVHKINTDAGTVSLSSFKETDGELLGNGFIEEERSVKNIKLLKSLIQKDKFIGHFVIKTININPADSAIIIIAEISQHSSNSVTREVYTNTFIHKDIVIINFDRHGTIKWIKNLPKSQIEVLSSFHMSVNGNMRFSYNSIGYFDSYGDMPYYSSYRSLVHENKLKIIFNDHPGNIENTPSGEKVRTVHNFSMSNLYGVSVDLAAGNMTRKKIYSNSAETILFPRDAVVVENEFIILWPYPHLLNKSEYRIATITVE
jgi:hypothetical protein